MIVFLLVCAGSVYICVNEEGWCRIRGCTVGQVTQVLRYKYWAACLPVRLFARSFAYSPLLALLARSAALSHSLARSLCSLPCWWDGTWLDGHFCCILFRLGHSGVVMIEQVKVLFRCGGGVWWSVVRLSVGLCLLCVCTGPVCVSVCLAARLFMSV